MPYLSYLEVTSTHILQTCGALVTRATLNIISLYASHLKEPYQFINQYSLALCSW
jgi:hypothetical protein